MIRKLGKFPTLAQLKVQKKVMSRMGIIPGDKKKELRELQNKPYLEMTQFPEEVFLELDAARIPPWKEPFVHSLHGIKDFEEFKKPQLLIKQSYSVSTGRFRAVLVRSDDPIWGVICKKTYLSVRDLSTDRRHIRGACLVYNSLLATYFLILTSSRLGHYITEANTRELMMAPLPEAAPDLSSLTSFEDIDELTRTQFNLSQSEWAIIEEFLDVTLPDALRQSPGPGRLPTNRRGQGSDFEPELSAYARTIFRVLKGTFGSDKNVAATIYQEPPGEHLPVRVLTLHFDWPGREPLTVERIEADGLLDKLADFHRDLLKRKARAANGEGLGFQRVAFLFHSHQAEHGRVRNLTIIKPDECRFWTRSIGMRDADDLAAAIFKAAGWKDDHR